jgi:hypothetical protein
MKDNDEYIKILDVMESDKYSIGMEEAQTIFSQIVKSGVVGTFLIFGRRIFVKKSVFDEYVNCIGLSR